MQSIQSRNNSNCMLSTSSNSSTSSITSPGQTSGKLMSISSIIATAPMFNPNSPSPTKFYHKEAMERRASAPSHPYHHPQRYPSSLFRSPPTSPEDKLFESSTPSSPSSSVSSLSPKRSLYLQQQQHHYQTHNQQQLRANKLMTDEDEDDEMLDETDPSQPPLTLQERRLRNKAASAKYRQKKNQQQNEMRSMIGRLSEQNAVLERQLQELRLENDRLKATTDRLRGKMVAKKMLKKWIGRQSDNGQLQQQQNSTLHRNNNATFHHRNSHPYGKQLNNSNHNYSALSESSSEQDDGINAGVTATISDDQDEDDELESISSD